MSSCVNSLWYWRDKYLDYYFLKECIHHHVQMSVVIDNEGTPNAERDFKKISVKQYLNEI